MNATQSQVEMSAIKVQQARGLEGTWKGGRRSRTASPDKDRRSRQQGSRTNILEKEQQVNTNTPRMDNARGLQGQGRGVVGGERNRGPGVSGTGSSWAWGLLDTAACWSRGNAWPDVKAASGRRRETVPSSQSRQGDGGLRQEAAKRCEKETEQDMR